MVLQNSYSNGKVLCIRKADGGLTNRDRLSALLTILTHIDKSVIGKGVFRVSVRTDVDIALLLLLTCLIQNLGEERFREGLRWVLLGLVIFVIGRNLL